DAAAPGEGLAKGGAGARRLDAAVHEEAPRGGGEAPGGGHEAALAQLALDDPVPLARRDVVAGPIEGNVVELDSRAEEGGHVGDRGLAQADPAAHAPSLGAGCGDATC